MNDVAREAAVSLKTVSRFVNGETNITPALADRIGSAIQTLGYRRNLAAASIRPGRASNVLGLIISDISNPYYSTLTRSIEAAADESGYLLISASSDEDGARHDRIVDRLLEQRVDGLLVVPPRQAARSWYDVTPPVPPIVFLDRPLRFGGAESILADNRGGAQAATAELLRSASSRVAFIGDNLNISTMHERFEGYCAALDAASLPVDPLLVSSSAHSSEQAATIIHELMRTTDVDAVFAANNRASVGAIQAFARAGRRLPLIGFDDFEAAHLTTPAVSVVTQDIAEMGRTAAQRLIARLRGDVPESGEPDGAWRVLETRLVLRGSEVRDAAPDRRPHEGLE